MDKKENYLAFLNHEKTDFVPNRFTDICRTGGASLSFETGIGTGYDGYGVKWIPTASANGAVSPAPNVTVLEDITQWEDVVKFPDLDAFDWQALADMQMAANRDRHLVVEFHSWHAQFLRIAHLMGFGESLIAMLEEPEAYAALLSAITDYKIRCAEYAVRYFKPDTFVSYIDVASANGLIMSPELYRSVIKPEEKRLYDAVKEMGMIPQVHCCGKCEAIIPDFIEQGCAAWASAQPSNDIAGIIEKYGDRIGVNGGYDTQGLPGKAEAPIEVILAEVDRCFDEYARFGRSYCFAGIVMGSADDKAAAEKLKRLIAYSIEKCSKK